MNITKQVIILTASLADRVDNNIRNTALNKSLTDRSMSFKEVSGVYKGSAPSTSFLVLPKNEAEIDVLKRLAFDDFGQESILHQDSNQEARLFYNDDKIENLGRLQEVNINDLKSHDSYTIVNGKYFSTKKRIA